jgi:hypothetical protein
MTRASDRQGAPPAPTAASISAALAALGAYATAPSEAELQRQALAVGGETVLAAVLANALYGAAIGAGMMAEGHMLEAGASSDALELARNQVLTASGATGPGVPGMLHWQAAQIAGPLRGWSREHDLGPMGGAAAATAWALTLILEACTVTDVTDARFMGLGRTLDEATEALAAAQRHLQGLRDTARSLAVELFPDLGL